MTQLRTTTTDTWTTTQAFALACVSLRFGLCGGWLLRLVTASTAALTLQTVVTPVPIETPSGASLSNRGQILALPPQDDLKKAADLEAAPLLVQLKARPTDAGLLTKLGNIYYDAKQYTAAISYYEQSLKSQPNDTSVRTDLGTAYWYQGDPDTAISEFNMALLYEPTKADTLFNLGIVEWQGKKNSKAAAAAWQKLLDANPGYVNKDKVQQLIGQVRTN